MKRDLPKEINLFLQVRRIAVAGVSRKGDTAANAVLKKLLKTGFDAIPINPNAAGELLEGVPAYETLMAVPDVPEAVVIATHPDVSAEIVRQCAVLGIQKVWFHRSIGQGSVSEEALTECREKGIEPIVGGCPLMFCKPVDPFHKVMRCFLQKNGTVPSCR